MSILNTPASFVSTYSYYPVNYNFNPYQSAPAYQLGYGTYYPASSLQNQQVIASNDYQQTYFDPVFNRVNSYATADGLQKASDIVYNTMSQLYGSDMSTGEMFTAQAEFQRLQLMAAQQGRPVNASDVMYFMQKQLDLVNMQYNTMTNMMQQSADRVSEAGDVINSAYKKAVADGKKISEG